MKLKIFFVFLLGILVQGTFATHIIKAPGSTTDIYSELPIQGISDADTLFIEGGTGDIILQAGPVNNTTYDWNIGTGSITTYTITFTYANATVNLPDGSKGRLIGCVCPAKGILRWRKTLQQCCTDRIVKPPNAARGERLW